MILANNWETGHRGFKATLDDIQQKELFNCWIQNDWKNTPAKEMLKRLYGLELPKRTFAEYKRRLKKKWEETASSADRIVDWHDFNLLAAHNIPSHLLPPLRLMSDSIEMAYLAGDRTFITPEYMKPSYRNLKWWAYLIQYYRTFIPDYSDRQLIAEQYALREFRSEFANAEFIREDLDIWLMYRPWETDERERYYLEAISQGKFPALQFSFEDYGLNRAYNTPDKHQKSSAVGLSVVNRFIAQSPKPYLLPTQIRENYRNEIQSEQTKTPDGEAPSK